MAQYRFKIGTFKINPKQYLVIDEELVALHLTEGTEEIQVPGKKAEPPRTETARAVTQADLAFLYNNPKGRHPFVEEVPEKVLAKTRLLEQEQKFERKTTQLAETMPEKASK